MTAPLLAALKGIDTIRAGFVIRTPDGAAMSDFGTK